MHVSMVFASVSRKAGGLLGVGQRLAQELARLPAARVDVIGLADEFSERDASDWAPVPVHTGKLLGPRILGWSPRYRTYLAERRPDLIHQHGIWTLSSFETERYSRAHHVPLVVSLHGMMDPWAVQNSSFKKRIAWLSYQQRNLEQAQALLVTSIREAEMLRSLGIQSPIALIPNAVDRIIGAHPAPWREELGDQRRVLLFLGRLHPKKGVSELLHGFASFRQGHPEHADTWSLVITGWDDGGYEEEFRSLARKLGLAEPALLWTGPLFGRDRDAALSHADAFILPSHSEGMPLAALEALSAGVPVLLTNECNLPIVFEHQAGISISATEDGVVHGISTLTSLSSPEREKMGERGEALVQESFTWSKVAEDTMRIYRWLLREGEKPAELLI